VISVRTTADVPLELTATIERLPALYVDSDSLFDIAQTPTRKARLQAAFEQRGTLMLSWANVLEISVRTGRAAEQVKELLACVGRHWFPIELNPFRVSEREHQHSAEHPALSKTFLRSFVLEGLSDDGIVAFGDEFFSVGRIVEYMATDNSVRGDLETFKTTMLREFERLRQHYRTRPPGPSAAWDPRRPTTCVLAEAYRVVADQARSHAWTANDSLDFMHAVMGLSTSQIVLLDGQWKARAALMDLGPTRPIVMYRAELDDALALLEAWPA
jgi:hypothetical protein